MARCYGLNRDVESTTTATAATATAAAVRNYACDESVVGAKLSDDDDSKDGPTAARANINSFVWFVRRYHGWESLES